MRLPGLAVRSTSYVKGPETCRTLPHDAPLGMPPPGPYIPQTMHAKTSRAASVFFNTMPSTRVEKKGGGGGGVTASHISRTRAHASLYQLPTTATSNRPAPNKPSSFEKSHCA